MSCTSITKTCEVSETDSDSSNGNRRHRYNTRSTTQITGKYPIIPEIKTRKVNKRQKYSPRANYKNRRNCSSCFEDDRESMDYCFDPCAVPSEKNWKNFWTTFSCILFYVLLIGTLAFVLYSQYLMHSELKFLSEDVQKLKGGHKREDPHAKLSKELDKKCSEALKLLLKDSVGRPDFALHSSGGKVLSTESVAYSAPTTFLGFKLCEGQHGPLAMIQATTSPGECWAFQGNTAKAVIELIDEVLVDSVTVEHIPPSISPSGTIDTAPKDFKIWGLDKPNGGRRLLGQFCYDNDNGTIETFNINNNQNFYKYIEFEVLSNHGNRDFTCVYRVRVHGIPKKYE